MMFDKKRHIVLSKNIQEEYEDESYMSNFFTFERNEFILSKVCPFFQYNIPLSLYNTIFLAYILMNAFLRILSGSHFFSQIVFGFILGFFWGHYFYLYLRTHIFTFIADIMVYPGSR